MVKATAKPGSKRRKICRTQKVCRLLNQQVEYGIVRIGDSPPDIGVGRPGTLTERAGKQVIRLVEQFPVKCHLGR